MTPRKVAIGVLLALLALGAPREAAAYCPSYSPASQYNSHGCAVPAYDGQNPSTAEWNSIFDLVSQGPAVWGNMGPSVGDIGQGCGQPEPLHSVPARFPCELLKGIAMQESGWRQFCVPDDPPDQVGGSSRTIISFDCGYGVGQVTSGMHFGESPAFDRDRVANDPTYNLATGTQIIADKWRNTECVGDNQPSIIEDWYIATWAYNGLAYVNNPNNPNYDANRGVYDPQIGGGAPYQEKVFGWIEHTSGMWPPTSLAYPNRGDVGNSGAPGALPEPSCASPTDCSNTRSIHATMCNGTSGSSGSGAGAGAGGGSPGSGAGAGSASSGSGGGGGEGSSGTPSSKGCMCQIGAEGESPAGLGLWALLLGSLLRSRLKRGRDPRRNGR